MDQLEMGKIKGKTRLICPDSEIRDYSVAFQCDFWIDEQNVWNMSCCVCGGEHTLGEMQSK